jgi:hypothetical protein
MKKLITVLLAIFIFLTSEAQEDKSFKFEKIIFHTTGCFGTCPTYNLEIDNDKTVKLFTSQFYAELKKPLYIETLDTSKMGHFTGSINNRTYNDLINILQASNIDSLSFDSSAMCCDGSVKTIIIYYNGKKKYLKSMFPPDKADNLIGSLYAICKDSNLKRTTEKFKIED